MPKVLILAVTAKVAEQVANSFNLRPSQWVYVYKAEQLRGIPANTSIVVHDSWHSRKHGTEARTILKLLKERGMELS